MNQAAAGQYCPRCTNQADTHLQYWGVIHIQQLPRTAETYGCLQIEEGAALRVCDAEVVIPEGTQLLLHDQYCLLRQAEARVDHCRTKQHTWHVERVKIRLAECGRKE